MSQAQADLETSANSGGLWANALDRSTAQQQRGLGSGLDDLGRAMGDSAAFQNRQISQPAFGGFVGLWPRSPKMESMTLFFKLFFLGGWGQLLIFFFQFFDFGVHFVLLGSVGKPPPTKSTQVMYSGGPPVDPRAPGKTKDQLQGFRKSRLFICASLFGLCFSMVLHLRTIPKKDASLVHLFPLAHT